METFSYHSNETTWATVIRNIIHVKASVLFMEASIKIFFVQLELLVANVLRRFFFTFFPLLNIQLPLQPVK